MFSRKLLTLGVMYCMTAVALERCRLVAQSGNPELPAGLTNWLRQKISAFGSFSFALRNDDGTTVTDTTASVRQSLVRSGCHITVGSVWNQTSHVYPEATTPSDHPTFRSTQVNSSTVDLRDLDPETLQAIDEGPDEVAGYPRQTVTNGPAHLYVVTMVTSEKKNSVEYHGKHVNADGSHQDSNTQISSVDLIFTDPNIANLAVKAMTNAINACQKVKKKD